MSRLEQPYNANDLPRGNNSFEPIPAGNYDATITQAELKNTYDGTGEYIKLRLDVTGPTHEGRVIFANLNIKNATLKAEEIGRQQLGEIMRAIGLGQVSETDQWVGGRVSIKVTIRPPRTDERTGKTYGASNEVRGYRAISGVPVQPDAVPFFASPAAPPKPAKHSPPWQSK